MTGVTARAIRAFTLAFLLAGLARPMLSQGGPPFVTDDPGTPGNRQWEINMAFTFERTSDGRTFDVPLIDANYGAGERIQLKIEAPWLVQSPENGPRQSGVGNALVGVKWRFVDEQGNTPALAVYPQVRLPGHASPDDRALLLPLSVQKKIGEISANAEIGYFLHRDQPDDWIAGLAFGHEFSKSLEGIAEIFATADRRLENPHALFHIGARYELGRHATLLVAAGRGLGQGPEDPRFDGYLGAQIRF